MCPGNLSLVKACCSAAGLHERVTRRGDELQAKHITGVRNFQSWLEPMGVTLSNCFRPRKDAEDYEVPHCFIFVKGQALTRKQHDMMNDTVEDDAVYCLVKEYVRDVNLLQPPVFVTSPMLSARVEPKPCLVHSMQPLSDEQIRMYSKLATLCAHKFALPNAAAALEKLLQDRTYEVTEISWLEQCNREFHPCEEGHAYFPQLPRSCWQLVASIRQ